VDGGATDEDEDEVEPLDDEEFADDPDDEDFTLPVRAATTARRSDQTDRSAKRSLSR
jgi:hypothetical protein